MTMSYYEVPQDIMENSEEIMQWVEKSYTAAINAKQKKKK